jgi:hypothetical protein
MEAATISEGQGTLLKHDWPSGQPKPERQRVVQELASSNDVPHEKVGKVSRRVSTGSVVRVESLDVISEVVVSSGCGGAATIAAGVVCITLS